MVGVANFMRGPTKLRQIVDAYLSSAMPPMIDLCRTNWELNEYMLPYPQKYDAYEPYVGEGDYPLVGMYVVGDGIERGRVDYDAAAAEEYQVEYNSRLFVAVASPTTPTGDVLEPPYRNVVQVREDMTTVLRQCLLNRNSLGVPGLAFLIEETIQADYPDPMISKALGGKYLATGIISCTIRITERLQRTPYGTVETATHQIIPFIEE